MDALRYTRLSRARGESIASHYAHCHHLDHRPQVINQSRYNKSVDWYALGVLIFEMLTGLPPFHRPDDSPMALYARIQSGPSCIRFPAINILAKDLILKFLETDPSKRYGNLRNGAGDVFSHTWFQEVNWEKLRNRDIVAPYLPKVTGEGDASA
jgi:serine/threonine protein kinase